MLSCLRQDVEALGAILLFAVAVDGKGSKVEISKVSPPRSVKKLEEVEALIPPGPIAFTYPQ